MRVRRKWWPLCSLWKRESWGRNNVGRDNSQGWLMGTTSGVGRASYNAFGASQQHT